MAKPWVFHYAKWGPIQVSVMPRSNYAAGRVEDSNTGIVVTCDCITENEKRDENGVRYCGACGAMPGSVIVNDHNKPNCDWRALAKHIGFTAANQVLDANAPIIGTCGDPV